MPQYEERTYRKNVNTSDLVSYHMAVKETDLWVSAEMKLEKETRDLVIDCRQQLETYIKLHPEFAIALSPIQEDPCAPPIVKEMICATREIAVGPMASVAGAVAQFVGSGLLQHSEQVIVENGGDIFINLNRPAIVSIFAGSSPLSEKLGLKISNKQMPVGVCTSSANVGHSLSQGITDVCCLLSPSAALADGAATALGNRVKRKKDLEKVVTWAGEIKGIIGGVVVVDDGMAAWGDIELVEL